MKQIFTPEQRLELYELAHAELKKNRSIGGLCLFVYETLVKCSFSHLPAHQGVKAHEIMHFLPELLACKPSDTLAIFWWTPCAVTPRLRALSTAIRRTKKLIAANENA